MVPVFGGLSRCRAAASSAPPLAPFPRLVDIAGDALHIDNYVGTALLVPMITCILEGSLAVVPLHLQHLHLRLFARGS